MSEGGPRPRPGGSQRGPQPDPVRRPAPGVTELREGHRTGFGSPEGAVPASAGTMYRDIDPAGSGSIWKKTTPSGDTGWVELGAGGGGGSDISGMAARISNFGPITEDPPTTFAPRDSATGGYLLDTLWYDTVHDTTPMYDSGTPGRIYAPVDGIYRATAGALIFGGASEPRNSSGQIWHRDVSGASSEFIDFGGAVTPTPGTGAGTTQGWGGHVFGSTCFRMEAGDFVGWSPGLSGIAAAAIPYTIDAHNAWLELESVAPLTGFF